MSRFALGTAISAVLSLVVAAPALAQCGDGAGVCWEPHRGAGCILPDCCADVCKAAPHCCDVSWDQECADLAIDICDWVTCGTAGSCVLPHDSPGCEEITCCEFVCPLDAYCCFNRWDEFCAEEADRLCGVPACSIVIPEDAVDESEPCYTHINDGCNVPGFPMIDVGLPAVRRGKYSTGSPRDTDWYRFTIETPSRVRLKLTAEFPGQLLLVNGPCLGPLVVIAEAVGLPCGESVIELDLAAGTYACVVSAASPGRVFHSAFTCDEIDPKNPPDPKDPVPDPSPYGLLYALRMTVPSEVLGDLDGDGLVSQTDLAILLGAWGGSGPGDLNGDGVVGSPDLAILLGAWTG